MMILLYFECNIKVILPFQILQELKARQNDVITLMLLGPTRSKVLITLIIILEVRQSSSHWESTVFKSSWSWLHIETTRRCGPACTAILCKEGLHLIPLLCQIFSPTLKKTCTLQGKVPNYDGKFKLNEVYEAVRMMKPLLATVTGQWLRMQEYSLTLNTSGWEQKWGARITNQTLSLYWGLTGSLHHAGRKEG